MNQVLDLLCPSWFFVDFVLHFLEHNEHKGFTKNTKKKSRVKKIIKH